MKRVAWLATVLVGLCVSGAQAAPIVYIATLSGAAESPPNASPGTGFAQVTYDPVAVTLEVSVTFSGLDGSTTAAHIHCCVDAPGVVGVATYPGTFPGFPAGVTSGSYDGSWDLSQTSSYTASFLTASGGTATTAEAALANGLASGQAYLNIHTTAFPAGEIRGFLTPIPEPSALCVFGSGALVIGWRTRHRRRGSG